MSDNRNRGFDALRAYKPAGTQKPFPPYHSTPVENPDRAGRAPYNFVPAPEKVHEWKGRAAHDRYHPGLLSGEVRFEMRALTEFYIRGMMPLPEYRRDKQLKDVQEPFAVAGRPRLPGSSLRGMVRNLVEILSESPLGPVNDQRHYFRAVGSSPNPNDRAYEPQAQIYKKWMGPEGWNAPPKATPGKLTKLADKWVIQPLATPLYRVRQMTLPEKRRNDRGEEVTVQAYTFERIRFRVPGDGMPLNRDDWRPKEHPEAAALPKEGWIICSGPMPGRNGGKKKQWVIEDNSAAGKTIEMPVNEDDVRAYREGGRTYWIEKQAPTFDFAWRSDSGPYPCFYIEDPGGRRVAFGHTPFFRLPYRTTTASANPASDTGSGLNMAAAIFGSTEFRGRVAFEDATLVSDAQDAVEKEVSKVVLGQPKPTTYQHYLVQSSEQVSEAIHWDTAPAPEGRRVWLRGHKLYWHRPDAKWPPRSGKEGVSSRFRRARRGLVFQGKIRYENLHPEELGVLLAAIDLPAGCGHRLGMGKPLGMGSFETKLLGVTVIDREKRYESLGGLGARDATPAEVERCKAAFASWLLDRKDANSEEIWKTDRLRDLKALLTHSGLPPNWANRTRYLEWDKIENVRHYNEYQEVWYQEHGDRPITSKRRPLPPAWQVLDGAGMPDDPPISEQRLNPRPRRPARRSAATKS